MVLGTAIAVTVAGCALSPADSGHASASDVATSATPNAPDAPQPAAQGAAPAEVAAPTAIDADALAVLATLPVKGRAPMTGYARTAKFGTAWLDVDRNGCDTRNDILARDLTATLKSGSCKVVRGTLVSPYTGATIQFVRGNLTSTEVQIDHVVALADAWRTGAQQLSQAQRVALANDPANLFAVDGRSNQQKSDGDAATWLPASRAFRCTYVSHQVSVKAAYGLWVTPAEHDAMARVLGTCTTAAATSPVAPAVAPVAVAPAPAPASAGCDSNYSGACVPIASDVDCAGGNGNGPAYFTGTAMVVGSDIYRLDGDGDGIACE
ncbi:MAG: HNH endonuclease family protein [Terrimesophilobacter sp.]